jgi:hypothetical protein
MAPQAVPTYDGNRHFDFEPPRTESVEGVWEFDLANID